MKANTKVFLGWSHMANQMLRFCRINSEYGLNRRLTIFQKFAHQDLTRSFKFRYYLFRKNKSINQSRAQGYGTPYYEAS